MITIFDFGWKMEIQWSYICGMIEDGSLRRSGYSIRKIRKIAKLIEQYADSRTICEYYDILERFPKAAKEVLKK